MFDDINYYLFCCGLASYIGFLIIGPVIGTIAAEIDNKATIEVCKDMCLSYDKQPQCLNCCETVDWRYSNECY